MSVRDAERFRLLYDLGCAFAARTQLDDLVPVVIENCRDVMEAEGAAVLLVDETGKSLYFPYTAATATGDRLRDVRFPADRGVAGAVLRSGRSERVDDVAGDSRFYPDVDARTGFVTRALLCVPLRTRTGTIGVIEVTNPRGGGAFTDDDLRFLEALAGSIAVALDNARMYAALRTSEGRLRAQVGALRVDLARRDRAEQMVGTAPAMAPVLRLIDSAAASPIAVLIEGETGTGKELVARTIHRAGPRGEGPFIAVNCAAVPETLLESQLFGHRRGAFTGATQDQAGFFEAAGGGTIFLDEVGEMPAPMQAKLLRVLQEGEIVPVGDTRPRPVDVRLISATNRDLAAEVAAGRFREDLFYRVAAFPIRLPPLRERAEDIPVFLERFLAVAARRHGKRIDAIEPDALAALMQAPWPGNVRQVQNVMERAVALAVDGDVIALEHLAPLVGPPSGSAPAETAEDTSALRRARAAFEARFIAEALREHGGNVTHAARALGLSRVMLQKKMKEYLLR